MQPLTSDKIGEVLSLEKPVSLEHSSLVATANERDTTDRDFYILKPNSNSRFRNQDRYREHSVELVAPIRQVKPASKNQLNSPLDSSPPVLRLTEAKQTDTKRSEKAVQTTVPKNSRERSDRSSSEQQPAPRPTAQDYLDLIKKENSMLCNMIYAQNNMIRCISDDIDKANSRNKKLTAAVMTWLIMDKKKSSKQQMPTAAANSSKRNAGSSLPKKRMTLKNPLDRRRLTVAAAQPSTQNRKPSVQFTQADLRRAYRGSSTSVTQTHKNHSPEDRRPKSHHDSCCCSYVRKRHPSFVEQAKPGSDKRRLRKASKADLKTLSRHEMTPTKQARKASSKKSSARKKVIQALADIFSERIGHCRPQ